MEKQYQLSLNRWHKVAERLNRRAGEISRQLRDGFNNTEVMGYLGEGQQQRLRQEGEALSEKFESLYEVQDAIVTIRQQV